MNNFTIIIFLKDIYRNSAFILFILLHNVQHILLHLKKNITLNHANLLIKNLELIEIAYLQKMA